MIVAQSFFQHGGLFGNLFGHEMFKAAFVHSCGIHGDRTGFSIGQSTVLVVNLKRCSGDHGKITLFHICDFIGQRGECNGIRAHIGFAIAMANRQWGTLACSNHQIILAFEEKREREGTL